VLIVDTADRTVAWLGRSDDYQPVSQSMLVALGPAELAAQLDWP
jgi:hypothetical protein